MAKTYSHDLKVGDRLDKLSDSAMKATDEGFYGTASVKELVGWKISKNPIKYPLAPLSDVVAILGIHLVVSDDFGVTDIAYNNNSDIINKAHSMSNFTYHFVRGKEV